ncbi:hypothetical protein [Mycobacterium asiaticum]|uniref:Uncharacterized protein n=1 Tax=Mycobacterium asiaticum TaxID=1790 RepID=A0A1A3C860_MYCAS|nr:hypothetical protein [Mycobacterium asiaticum]OBI83254.1 hypothetical protein A9X01_21140 [Mycobacterium asiaticum]
MRVRDKGGDGPGWHDPFDRLGRRGGPTAGTVLRLGLLYADGRRGATSGNQVPGDPEHLALQQRAGGGSYQQWDGKFWVHPLPPEGPVTFIAAWPEYVATDVAAKLDGAAIRSAAADALILWPEDSETDPAPARDDAPAPAKLGPGLGWGWQGSGMSAGSFGQMPGRATPGDD